MTLNELLARMGLTSHASRARSLYAALPGDTPADWRKLASVMALHYAVGHADGPVALGVSGGQGAGKTTLSLLLERSLALVGRKAVSLSLDDFYLTKAERRSLGVDVHPLLATRGVPGTHDVALATSVIGALKQRRAARCPTFDKAADDRRPAAEDRVIEPGVDFVIFEGWCVGATPQPEEALLKPVNELERSEDPDGRWRRFVDERLREDYATLWEMLDALLYLKVPDIEAVIRWRTEQELQHPQARRMTPAALDRFVAHYERLTLWMAESVPLTADFVGFLDENHELMNFTSHEAGR